MIKLFCILLILTISFTNGCYITNCPWGGKRSGFEPQPVHECRKCAGGLGTCFGPKICCGKDIGCLIDSPESATCKFEDARRTKPCQPYGKECKKLEFGRCATDNLCCNPEYCVPDLDCSFSKSESMDSSNEFINEKSHLLNKKL